MMLFHTASEIPAAAMELKRGQETKLKVTRWEKPESYKAFIKLPIQIAALHVLGSHLVVATALCGRLATSKLPA